MSKGVEQKQAQFARTALLLGEQGIERLQRAHVLVFGVGGVGGHAIESFARSGIGRLTLVDPDVVCESNINRQVVATWDSVGRSKVEVMKERIQSISPDCEVVLKPCFYLPEEAHHFDFTQYDYVVDAIDTITAKIDLAVRCEEMGVPLISSMGAGNKLDPSGFMVSDIYQTSVCPLAKVMRRELKKRGVNALKVVYSREEAQKTKAMDEKGKPIPGSIAFVPAVAGLVLAGAVIRDLASE